MSVDEGGWRWQADVVRKQFPMNTITSTFRNNSVASGSTSGDYHSRGRAVDVGGPNLMNVFNWIATTFPQSAEIIYSPANNRQVKNGQSHMYSEPTRSGHFNHVHWAFIGPTTVGAPYTGTDAVNSNTTNAGIDPSYGLLPFITNSGNWTRFGLALLAAVFLFFAVRATMKVVT